MVCALILCWKKRDSFLNLQIPVYDQRVKKAWMLCPDCWPNSYFMVLAFFARWGPKISEMSKKDNSYKASILYLEMRFSVFFSFVNLTSIIEFHAFLLLNHLCIAELKIKFCLFACYKMFFGISMFSKMILKKEFIKLYKLH